VLAAAKPIQFLGRTWTGRAIVAVRDSNEPVRGEARRSLSHQWRCD